MQFLKTYLRVLKLLGSEKRLATILALCNLALAAAQRVVHRVLGHAAGEGELAEHAARAGEERHRAQDDGAMEAGQDVFALLAHREAVAQLGAGARLEPGQVMLSGSFIRPIWAQKGDTVHADFGSLGGLAEIAKEAFDSKTPSRANGSTGSSTSTGYASRVGKALAV